MIYPTLISKIQTVLEGVDNVKEIFAYPASKITKYPAVVFYPSTFDNEFETNQSNFKIYGFKVFVIVGATQKNISDIYSSVMPNTLDAVLQAFDSGWDFDSIDGHRAWTKIDTGEWSVSSEQDGLEVTAEIDLQVKLLTSN